jgi:VWFA-related protein
MIWMNRPWLVALSFTVSFLICLLPANSQNTKAAGSPSFELRLNVRQVPVDVIVLDGNGNPVRGLKEGDFIVSEDGKRQRIESFDWFDGSAIRFKPPPLPPLPPNTFVDVPKVAERGPLYVLYYDMVNTSKDDQMAFHGQLLRFIDTAPAGVRMALFVNAEGLHLIQGFTTDRDRLREAILQERSGPHVPKVFIFSSLYGCGDAGAALSNLTFIAQYLEGIPGRKNLIWMASSFPIPTGPAPIGAGLSGKASGALLGASLLDLSPLLREAIEQTYYALMRSQIALYPVSVTGVVGGLQALVEYDQMNMIAAATGGRAYYSNNDLRFLLDQAVK